jgi:hypothetical protein
VWRRPDGVTERQGSAMNHADEDKARNREIAENEAERQTIGDIRVSTWAIVIAVVIALVVATWVMVHR